MFGELNVIKAKQHRTVMQKESNADNRSCM